MVKNSTSQKPKRRSPITRAEGEQRLINAAIQLVRERPISEVGVRDIATVADVNHGFVHTWFGSKNDLLIAATRPLVEQARGSTKSLGWKWQSGSTLKAPIHVTL